ncbi:hypothetical protein JCM3766R1_005319 [Sporobolomyces carnicolor]
MLIEGIKFSCGSCIKGHRQANCSHADRELFEVKKRGRPISACETCRQIRKESNSHKTCTHCVKVDASVLEPDLVRSLPNGASDTASMALVRRASSVRSRSSASSANHPPLPGSTSIDLSPDEDLATIGRKKSVSKSRRKDSKSAKDPHDLSHGHSAHHPTHHSSQFSPYPPAHAHPSLPKPATPSDGSPLCPQPISNSDLASAFFFRDFEKLEANSSASSSGPGRPDSAISASAVSPSSEGAESSPEFKEPLRRPSIAKEYPHLPPPATVRPVKERKRSGLAQMYGATDEEEEADDATRELRNSYEGPARKPDEISGEETRPLPVHATSFHDGSIPFPTMENHEDGANRGGSVPRHDAPPSSSAFSLPPCDYAVPRQYVPAMVDYSSTAPSAYSAYSGYTPPLERTTSYSVEEEEDPLGALSELQPQQTDLDILEWISTIAPLPPSSTPASAGDASAPSSTVPSFDFQPGDWTVSTPTSYPEPPPSSVGIASSDFAGLVLSPSGEYDSSTKSFPLPLPSDASSLPERSASSSTSRSFSQSQSQSYSQSQEDESFLFPDFARQSGGLADLPPPPPPLPPAFDSGDIHLERYGIDESYFARLGSFEPTATPTSTPVHEAFAGWQNRIEQTKGLMLQEFGEKLQQQQQQQREQQQQHDEGGDEVAASVGEQWDWQGKNQVSSEEEILSREIRAFATGSRGRGGVATGGGGGSSNDSGSRERYQVDESGTGPDNSWWLKLNA